MTRSKPHSLCGFDFSEGSISLAQKQKKQKNGKPISKDGFLWCFYLGGTHLFRFFGLNLVTLACCVSVVLLPAGVSAAFRACAMLLRGRSGLFWEEYRDEFKSCFLKKLACWLMMLLIPVGLGLWTHILGFGPAVTEGTICILLALSVIFQAYWFNLIVLLDLPMGTNVKNAFLLMVLEWKTTLAFGFAFAVILAAVYFLYPYSLLALFFLLLSAMILCVCQQCQRIFARRGLLLPKERNAACDARQKG